jgi:endonuclease/exonuclease/phosphatase family metal-dependent hydrolase
MKSKSFWIFMLVFLIACAGIKKTPKSNLKNATFKFATYNTSLFQKQYGGLINKLEDPQDEQAIHLAKIIRSVKPDFLLLQEFDYDSAGLALNYFKKNFLQNLALGQDTIQYRYGRVFSSNTGINSGVDIDENGKVTNPGDAYGFGFFEGQYGFAVLSRFPFDTANIRTFQKFKWIDMPGAALPTKENGTSYYSNEAKEVFRLSSKNHVDLPLQLPGGTIIHALLSHPTPPVFDGKEDRNGKRNHDEIRLWKDYIQNASYLKDDKGGIGGLDKNANFIIMGDMNADPNDGDSYQQAIRQLLDLDEVNPEVAYGKWIPKSEGGKEARQKEQDIGDPEFDTSFFGLRVDYVLPDKDLNVTGSGVIWPSSKNNHLGITKGKPSDHLMVWLEFSL